MDRLVELQDLDLSIDRLTGRLHVLESENEVREARAQLSQAEARLGELRLGIDAVGIEQRRLEGDIDSLAQKIEAERTRLYDGSVASPKELQAIESEVEGLRARKSRVEDYLIEQMERREELEGRLPQLEAAETEARTQLEVMERGSASELVAVEADLRAQAETRHRLVPELDPELLELYEELRRSKKGVGAAALVDGVCQGCHQKLSPVYVEGLKRTEGVRRCEYCRRILVIA